MTWWADSTMEHAWATFSSFSCVWTRRGPKFVVLNATICVTLPSQGEKLHTGVYVKTRGRSATRRVASRRCSARTRDDVWPRRGGGSGPVTTVRVWLLSPSEVPRVTPVHKSTLIDARHTMASPGAEPEHLVEGRMDGDRCTTKSTVYPGCDWRKDDVEGRSVKRFEEAS